MLYLVGSHALKHYGVDLGREPGDYDVYSNSWKNEYKFMIPEPMFRCIKYTEKGSIFELNFNGKIAIFDIFENNLWDTDKIFQLIHGETISLELNSTGFSFTFIVAPKEILYIMYKTTAEVYKDEKSVRDFETIQKAWPNFKYRHELYVQRLKETQDYYDKTKKKFFEQHGLKQYIDHDKLHEMVTKAWNKTGNPIYLSILDSKDSTKIDIEKFRQLARANKIMLIVEEICVLLFERYFIYKTVTEGFNAQYVKKFFSNSKQSVTTKLISHVCEKGLKGEHPEIIKFAKENIKEITENVYEVKYQLKQLDLPEWFLKELETQREKYINDMEEIPF